MDLLGVQYDALIPILVAGFQEQNAEMAAQIQENEVLQEEVADLKTQMAKMQNQMTQVMSSYQSTQSKMNNCCGTSPTEKTKTETSAIELEQNFPNPFEDVTTINFSINERAQIRLEISDAQGRVLDVLVNETLAEGKYTERWDGSAVAPGTYYYSLYADTELLTKKMIKK
jgi:flagellar hook assembly protein FlgD